MELFQALQAPRVAPVLVNSRFQTVFRRLLGYVLVDCLAGSYAFQGSSSCALCPAGKYGNSSRLPSNACSGDCARNSFSNLGSILPTDCFCAAGWLNLAGKECFDGRWCQNSP